MRFYSRTAFVNQIYLKNATAFFTNAFNRKPAFNKEYSFNLFALVLVCIWRGGCSIWCRQKVGIKGFL